MARAAVKVKCGGPVRRRQAQLASILPLVYAPFQQNSRKRLSLFLLTCSMVTLRLLPWQQHLLLHQPSARYDTIFLCKSLHVIRSEQLQFLVRLQSVCQSGNCTKPPKISVFLHNLRARSLHLPRPRPWQQLQSRPLAVMRYIITCIEKAYCRNGISHLNFR